jgi:hypothetical protein
MKTFPGRRLLVVFILVMAAVLACSFPWASATGQPADQPPPPPDSTPDTGSAATQEPPAEPLSPTATVAHTTYPTNPGSLSSWVTDPSSSAYASERRAVSDLFSTLFFERPFTQQVMDYQAYLDITRGELSVGSPFAYATIFLEGSPPAGSTALYGIEIDLDRDGRGDWLVYGQVPATSDWTSAEVRVYKDSDNDVGDGTPVEEDGSGAGLNGFDDMEFDMGYNTTDPDAAWIRRDPSNASRVQLAFKMAFIGSPNNFLWGVWSDEGPQNPAWFDYNDHFTLSEAGSPDTASSQYPVKALYSVDNTCRYAYGFTPTTNLPGMCKLPPTPTPTPVPGSISGGVWHDNNNNASRDGGEPGFSGATVRLGSGACPSTGLKTTTTNSSGNYSFSDLPPGTYCVSVNEDVACDKEHSTPESYTITVNPGANTTVPWIGYAPTICFWD